MWEKVCGIFLMPSNGKNTMNFFSHLIFFKLHKNHVHFTCKRFLTTRRKGLMMLTVRDKMRINIIKCSHVVIE